MKILASFIGAMTLFGAAGAAQASELVYRPINPSLGGDPLNGNWLLSQATAQTAGGGSPGFSIDFPDFGSVPQPPAEPEILPEVPGALTTPN